MTVHTVSRPPFGSFNVGCVHNKLLLLGVISGSRLKPSDMCPFTNKSIYYAAAVASTFCDKDVETMSLLRLKYLLEILLHNGKTFTKKS